MSQKPMGFCGLLQNILLKPNVQDILFYVLSEISPSISQLYNGGISFQPHSNDLRYPNNFYHLCESVYSALKCLLIFKEKVGSFSVYVIS
jgi:hypothetical protein